MSEDRAEAWLMEWRDHEGIWRVMSVSRGRSPWMDNLNEGWRAVPLFRSPLDFGLKVS